MSRWDRLLIFGGLNLGAIALFATCFALMATPLFLARPSKFAVLLVYFFLLHSIPSVPSSASVYICSWRHSDRTVSDNVCATSTYMCCSSSTECLFVHGLSLEGARVQPSLAFNTMITLLLVAASGCSQIYAESCPEY